MPMDATEIYLDGNDLPVLKSHSLIGRKNLRVLHLNNSNIQKIENKTFNGLKTLRALHLQNNKLKSLQGFEFSGLTHLRELYLQGNLISSIHNATFKALRSLEVLSLEGNSIIDFPIWQLAMNPYLVSIRIANNLWSCDCQFLNRFATWIKVFNSRVLDGENLSCVSNEATESDIRVLDYKSELCDVPSLVIAKTELQVQDQHIADYWPLMTAVVASLTMLLISGLVIFSFRHSIKIWVQSKHEDRPVLDSRQDSPNPSTYSEPELFDVFVHYSPLDEMFVRTVLAKQLEAKHRVCLQHRDLPAQSDQVGKVMATSKKTIVVLSNNYLRTEWARTDYKSGLVQASADKNVKLIFVLVGPQDSALTNPTICQLLTNNVILQWGEAQFWSRLSYALPVVCSQRMESHYYSTCKFPLNYTEKDNNVISHI